MKIGKLGISLAYKPDKSLYWCFIEYDYSLCNCRILTLGCVVFEWLSKECKENACYKD